MVIIRMLHMKVVDASQWPCEEFSSISHFSESRQILCELWEFFSASKDDNIDSYHYRTFLCVLPLQIPCINSKLGLKKCDLEVY
jgi:hypothetical protein